MANQELIEIFNQGVKVWNQWRQKHPNVKIDLSNINCYVYGESVDLINANLEGANLTNANLTNAFLSNANLENANLYGAKLQHATLDNTNLRNANLETVDFYQAWLPNAILDGANLKEAQLFKANLEDASLIGANLERASLESAKLINANLQDARFCEAYIMGARLNNANSENANFEYANFEGAYLNNGNFTEANLSGANLEGANLSYANFTKANLKGATLGGAICVETDFSDSDLQNTYVYGISAWNITTTNAKQQNLRITKYHEPVIMVDNLEVAQFIYLLLNNEKIRDVLGTIAKKGVLILGRFTPERKKILDAMRNKLRELDYVPMMFDFEKVSSRDFTETIKTLAGMSRFVIADISNPSSSPLELQATLPDYKIPFVPIIEAGQRPFAMFRDLTIYPWCLDVIQYDTEDNLMLYFQKGIIDRALEIEKKLLDQKATTIQLKNISDF